MIATFRPHVIVRPSVRDIVEAFLARIDPTLTAIRDVVGPSNTPEPIRVMWLIRDDRDHGSPHHWSHLNRARSMSRRGGNRGSCALCHRVEGVYRLGLTFGHYPSWWPEPDAFWPVLGEWRSGLGPRTNAAEKWREWAGYRNVREVEDPEVAAIAEFVEAAQ